jgi:hypothetical protein
MLLPPPCGKITQSFQAVHYRNNKGPLAFWYGVPAACFDNDTRSPSVYGVFNEIMTIKPLPLQRPKNFTSAYVS